MSNNAAGIPQVYVRTRKPVASRFGDLEFRILLGQLTPSRFLQGNGNGRSISAGVVTLRVPFDSGLTIGMARSVYGPVNGTLAVPKHWADVLWRWNQKDRFSRSGRPLNQIVSVFFQWVIPEAGFESYAEWARLSPPSLSDLIVQPQKGQGFTLGLQSLRPLGVGRDLRIQAEGTMLEQTPPSRAELVPLFYTSHISPAGYTQRGQSIGASLGPGGSSQFLALDFLRPSWSLGVQGGRTQWNHESYYRQATGLSYKHHDISIFGGVRGNVDLSAWTMSGELLVTDRLNFLFQGLDINAFDDIYDVTNLTLKWSIRRSARAMTPSPQTR